jgi:hypothetical protein
MQDGSVTLDNPVDVQAMTGPGQALSISAPRMVPSLAIETTTVLARAVLVSVGPQAANPPVHGQMPHTR